MIIIVAVDNVYGMLFSHRRISRDAVLREKILSLSSSSSLWMDSFSAKQFTEDFLGNMCVSETFLDDAGEGDFCFVEDRNILSYLNKIESIILFCWNRNYPSDFKLDLIPSECGFVLTKTEDFAGKSHDTITMEVWENVDCNAEGDLEEMY